MAIAQPVWPQPDGHFGTVSSVPDVVDVCVIGAGVAGLSVAYRLMKAGKRVLVLEAREVGAGMTSCSTAHLANVLDDRFVNLEKSRGVDACRLAAEAHGKAIDFIEETVAHAKIDCDFTRLDGYLMAADPGHVDALKEEAAAAGRAGLNPEWLRSFPGPGLDAGPLLRFARQARIDPTLYLAGLARAVTHGGGLIVTGARADAVADGDPCRVTVRDGPTVEAGAVVVATNSPFNNRVAIHTKQFPYMTYVVGLAVAAGAVPDVLLWDTLDPYHYARLAPKLGPAGEDVLVVGGEDHKTGQAHDHEVRFRRLEEWARKHYPAAGAVTHRWAGEVLETLDGLAYIGKNPGDARVFVATGDSGMGLTHGTIAGLLLPDLIAGAEHPWKDLFDPSRHVPRAALDFASENANVARQDAQWLTPGDVAKADAIPPGGGALVREGLSKRAVFRDADGALTVCSAKCPHLGAVVQWNDAEKTWDCPAHGSRFKSKGEVFEGPANSDLPREGG